MAAASTSSYYRCRCHVFLSFRGEDTRKGFTDRLYRALESAGIHTFRDDDEIERGADIAAELPKAIKESQVSIIVLSKDYASSRWCLGELDNIMERKRTDGHTVIPVFYKVDPSDVRNQIGCFAQAFAKHEARFEEAMVKKWRQALREVVGLGGMVLGDQYEEPYAFIQKIVEEIKKKLNPTTLNVPLYAVGIDYRVKGQNKWLRDGSDDVGVTGIYGMGGIGKTTIAKAAYNLNFDRFQGSSFLAEIRTTSEQPNGLVRLQMNLLSDIQKGKTEEIYDVNKGLSKIKNAICCKRVLIVLDDVNDSDQFDAIFGMREWFHPGSKIIITTRDEHLLKAKWVSNMFTVPELNKHESLQLFSWHAFRQAHPFESHKEVSTRAVQHCGGLPLALKVLGSSLVGKSVDLWQSALDKLDKIPHRDIQKVLRVSFDSLQDDRDKNLFLHISCFFIGKKKDFTISILDNLDFHTKIGIQNLVDRCLLEDNYGHKLVIHQLLVDMGKGIIRDESPDDPGNRSRVEHRDAASILEELTGTKSIKGLKLNLPMLLEGSSSQATFRSNKKRGLATEDGGNCSRWRRRLSLFSWESVFPASIEADFTTEAFRRMQNLELLLLNDVKLSGGYENFPKRLAWLSWQRFPLKFIPPNFYLGKLVVLELQNSSLQLAWKGTKFLPSLKILNLSHSHGLLRTPDLSGVPNLERLILRDCISMNEIDESIGDLEKLVILNLEDCKNLVRLPKRIIMLRSLQYLILSGCSKLGNVAAADWWQSFWSLVLPRKYPLSTSFSLAGLPHSLTQLKLSYCNISEIPSDLSILSSLKELCLSGNPIMCLPENMKSLTTLEELSIEGCGNLKTLPVLPPGLRSLKASFCRALEFAAELPNGWLLDADLLECPELVEVGGLFTIKPLGSVDIEMIKNMDLYDFESVGSTQVEMTNRLTFTNRTGPLQGLYECGIFSIFLHGSTLPDRYSCKRMGKSMRTLELPITLPSKLERKIRGLNLCLVYTRHPDMDGIVSSVSLKVSNVTKNLSWDYRPVTFGSPIENVDILWLSHWPFGKDDLEAGEKLSISVDGTFLIKELGVELVYEQENTGKGVGSESEDVTVDQEAEAPYWSRDDVAGNVSVSASKKYQRRAGEYMLCNYLRGTDLLHLSGTDLVADPLLGGQIPGSKSSPLLSFLSCLAWLRSEGY